MKKQLFKCAMMVYAATMLVSCSSDANLSCDVKKIAADVNGVQDSLMLKGTDGSCEVVYAPDWVNVSTHDTVVNYVIAANKDSVPREGCIVVTSGHSQLSIPVEQGVKTSYLLLTDNEVKMAREGDTVRVAVVTDGGKVNIEAFPEIGTALNGSYLTLISKKNEGKQISGEIKLTSGDISEKITVTIEGDVCPTCNSTGYVKCPKCKGQGNTFSMSIQGIIGCKTCGGKGTSTRAGDFGFRNGTGKVPCPTCKGK